jgi:hypothetical protein
LSDQQVVLVELGNGGFEREPAAGSGPEPFGGALYAGRPVVAIAIGDAQEIVDASCGRLVPTTRCRSLARHLGGTD